MIQNGCEKIEYFISPFAIIKYEIKSGLTVSVTFVWVRNFVICYFFDSSSFCRVSV
jgi:hypothetical protein